MHEFNLDKDGVCYESTHWSYQPGSRTGSVEGVDLFPVRNAVPFASRYRLIDFTLSNMMHAGVHDIALFIRRKYRSLLDHLGEGR